MKIPVHFLLLIPIMVLCSCNNSQEKDVSSEKLNSENLSDINNYLVEKDRERIQNYIERKNLIMKEAPSGLWYFIKNEGEGNKLTDGDRITFSYKCYLLDGTFCYSSDKLGPKEITLGRGELESGLYEGLKMLKSGGEAVFILPPYLAYGLIGDNNAIPPRATIVYEVKIIK